MELFWSQGFAATSTKALAEHMGINVYSLFAEFESKQGLFEATLELYRREVVENIFGDLAQPTAGLQEIVALFDFFVANAAHVDAERGCFACNTATERTVCDRASKDYIEAHVDFLERAFSNALANAKSRGEIRADVSCENHSKLLAGIVLGLSVLTRASIGPEFIADAARAACADLRNMV